MSDKKELVAAKRIDNKEAAIRIKDAIFDHVMISLFEQEFEEAKVSKPDLNKTDFMMGFFCGAKVSARVECILLYGKDPEGEYVRR